MSEAFEERAAAVPAHVVYRTAEYRKLRAKCERLTAENRALVAAGQSTSRVAIYRSDEYRKLRARCADLELELRQVRKTAKGAEHARHLRTWAQKHVERAEELLDSFVPREDVFRPERMITWHVREALAWATMSGSGAWRVKREVGVLAEEELPDAKREGAYVPAALRRELLTRGRCEDCGARDDLTIDHIVPVALGGRSDVDNLQVLCRSCNSRKGAKVASNGAGPPS
jgi:5-methylcytosine-specific restriction endonuclease McrA